MTNPSNDFTPEDIAKINETILANKRKLAPDFSKGKLPEVSSEEYTRRLRADRKANSHAYRQLKAEKIRTAMKDWGLIVGPKFAKATTELPQVLDRVERHEKGEGLHKTSLILHGNELGRGKTWTAFAYINKLVSLGRLLPGQIFFGTEASTTSRIANSGFERPQEMKELRNPKYKVYFIDDVGLGSYFRPEYKEEIWYELIDHIYKFNLTLVITTNLDMGVEKELSRWIGRRAYDRLRTLVGDDGVLQLVGDNKRDIILQNDESKYRKSRNGK